MGNGATIFFAFGQDSSQGQQILAAVNRWNSNPKNSKRFVRPVELPASADLARAQLVASAQGGSVCYDVVALDVIWTDEFAENNYIIPLPESALGANHKDILTGRLATARRAPTSGDGRLWAVPFTTTGGLLYYNQELAGEDIAKVWKGKTDRQRRDDLMKRVLDLRELYRNSPNIGVYAGQFAEYEGLTVNVLEAVWREGGAIVDRNGRIAIDSTEARRGLHFLADGLRDGWIPLRALQWKEQESRQAFENGELVFLRNWPFAYHRFSKDPESDVAGKFGVVPLPWPSVLGGFNLAVSRCSSRQDDALAFIRWLTGSEYSSEEDDNQFILFVKGGLGPTRRSVYDRLVGNPEAPYADVVFSSALAARSRPASPFYPKFSSLIQNYMYDAIQTGDTDRAAEDLVEPLQDALEGR